MGKLQIINDEARSRPGALGGRPNPLAKKSQLITETATALIRQVAGEIPPLGLEIRVRMMIARKLVLPSRLGYSPIRRHATNRQGREPARNPKSEICNSPHSLLTASAMSSRPARQAGIHPATIAAAMIQSGVQASDHQGKAS